MKRWIRRLRRLFVPSLLLLALAGLTEAQSLGLSSVQSLAGQVITIVLYVAAAGVVAAFAWGIFKLFGRDHGAGISWVLGANIAGYIVGRALVWATALTGVTVTPQ